MPGFNSTSDDAQSLNQQDDTQEAYKMALNEIKLVSINIANAESKKAVTNLIGHIENLKKNDDSVPITTLTAALKATTAYLSSALKGQPRSHEYEQEIKKVRSVTSTGMKMLAGLMLLVGIAILVASIVLLPLIAAPALSTGVPAAIAMKTAGCGVAAAVGVSIGAGLSYGGFGLFSRGSDTELSKQMDKINDEFRPRTGQA